MKNKLLALLAAFGLVSSATAVEINKNLSISGFIDGSYVNVDGGADSLDLDEVELQFDANVGNVSGSVHIDNNNGAGNDLEIEQAHFTYTLDNGLSITFGRYGSSLGLEREDPAGLYTYSRAYSFTGGEGTSYNLGDIDGNDNVAGITFSYAGDNYSIAASIEDDGSFGANEDELDIELSFSYTGFDNLTIGGGYFIDNEATSTGERDVLNVHASYTLNKTLLAAEYISADDATANNGEDAYTVVVDHDFSDKLGLALRYSTWETVATNGSATRIQGADNDKITIAPNYAITESLGAIIEYSKVETNGQPDSDEYAVELTYTF